MKKILMQSSSRWALGLVILSTTLVVNAATYLKLDDTNTLNDPASWNPTGVPGSGDIAQFDSTYASTNQWPLGAATEWAGIQILSPSEGLFIQNDGNTLTLGASGVDLSNASASLTLSNSIQLGVSQAWPVAANQALIVPGNISDGGLNYGLTFAGPGTNILSGANTFGGGVNLNGAVLDINSSTALGTGTLVVNGGTFGNTSAGGVTLANNNPQNWNADFTVSGSQYLTMGSGAVTMSAPRTLTVSGTNFTVNGLISGPGSLNVLDVTKLGTASMIAYSPTTLRSSGQTNAVNAGSLSLYGPISDGGAGYTLGKAGGGTLSLYGTNTYVGHSFVYGGSLTVQSNGVLNSSVVTIYTNCNFTINGGGLANGQLVVTTNSVSTANCIVGGTNAGNVTIIGASTNGVPVPASVQTSAFTQYPCGYLQVNQGGSLAPGGYITNNGIMVLQGSNAITLGTIISTAGLGTIVDKNTNTSGKTITLPSGTALAFFESFPNAVSTLQVQGNGSAYIHWFGYNDTTAMAGGTNVYTNTLNGGTWTFGQIGQNNSSCHFVGLANITGGAAVTVTNNAAYIHGSWNVENGSLTFLSAVAENHLANNNGLNISVNNNGGGTGFFTVTNGGMSLGLAVANTVPENNSLNVANGGVASIRGSSQNLILGTTVNDGTPETNAVNLSGGKLVVTGAVEGNTSTTGGGNQDCVFNWTGGQLSAASIVTGARFNDPNSYITATTVSNTAGVLAPGDVGAPGKTAITGAYTQTGGGTLAVDIGGTTAASSFTNLGAYFDFVSVSGSASVAGLVTANLINNFTPAANSAFTILTAAGGLVVNTATLGYNGLIPVYTNGVLYGGKYFQALVVGNNLILTNFGVSVGVLAAKFSPTNAIGVVPANPTFTDSSSGVITNRHWRFGDGATLDTTSTSVSHAYAAVGTYTVTLTVYGVDGSTSTATGTVKVTFAASNDLWVGGNGGNAWDQTTPNWFTNGILGTYRDPDNVVFDDSGNAASPVNVTTLMQPTSVTFSNVAKSYVLSGTGLISGNSSITLSGDGMGDGGAVTLLTTNNYTGATVINYGTLQVGNGVASGSIDGTSAITNNGVLIFNQSNTHSLGASLVGYGALVKSGAGTLILAGDNSGTIPGQIFSGPVTINGGGTLSVASDATLGQNNGSVEISNATLQVNSGCTLERNLTLDGTNDTLNVNGTVILQNALNGGLPTVTVGGAGNLQIDTGGSSVALPTNVVLNGGSLYYDRSDNFTQPGTIASISASSSVVDGILNNAGTGTAQGNTNTVILADGINQFQWIINSSSGDMVLDGSANSTNLISGGGASPASGSFGIGNGAAGTEVDVMGGNYFVTNQALFLSDVGGLSLGSVNLIGGTLVSSYYGALNSTDGGGRYIRTSIGVSGGSLHVTTWGLGFCLGNSKGVGPQSFTVNSGSVLVDDTGTPAGAAPTGGIATFYGLLIGSHEGANATSGNGGQVTAEQTGGTVTIAGSTNNNIEIGYGGTAPYGSAQSSYTLAGGVLSVVGGLNGGNVHIGGSADDTSSGALVLTNTGKLIASGSISGYSNGDGNNEVFTFLGGTLVANNVNMSHLSDVAGDPVGTLVNAGGLLSPGDAGVAGQTSITGNYTASNTASLLIDINGANPATAFTNSGAYYDKVAVSGTATLDGNLLVRTNGFAPAASRTFTILTAGSVNGTFANVTAGRVPVVGSTNTFGVVYTPTSVILTDYSGAPSALPTPAPIAYSFSGGALVLNWPNGQGWVLEVQTNSLSTGLSNNWVRLSGLNSPFTNNVSAAAGAVFYRLVAP